MRNVSYENIEKFKGMNDFLSTSERVAMDDTDRRILDFIIKNQCGSYYSCTIETLLDIYHTGLLMGHIKSALKDRDNDETLDSEIDVQAIIDRVKSSKESDGSDIYVDIADMLKDSLDLAFTKGYIKAIDTMNDNDEE